MNDKLNRLNCMNYCVADSEGQYYLQCGLRSLYRFSKEWNISFKDLCNTLSTKGYTVMNDGDTQIEMI